MSDDESPDAGPRPAGDYFVVLTRYENYYVTPTTAREIGRALDRWIQPRWLKFVDRNGARAWVRAGSVNAVYESTGLGRERERTFNDALRREASADVRWDEDEM